MGNIPSQKRHKQDGSQIGERTVDGDWIKFNPDGSQ